MEKKNIDWAGLGFEYIQTDKRFVANYKNGVWEEGGLTEEAAVIINEFAVVLQYSQSCFEGLNAYTTEYGGFLQAAGNAGAAEREICGCCDPDSKGK